MIKRSRQLTWVPRHPDDGLRIDPAGEVEYERRRELRAGRAPKVRPFLFTAQVVERVVAWWVVTLGHSGAAGPAEPGHSAGP